MDELKPIDVEKDARINISLNYQLYLQDMIRHATIAYNSGDIIERSNLIEELKRGISFKIKEEDKPKHEKCLKELKVLKGRYRYLLARTNSNNYEEIPQKFLIEKSELIAKINNILDNWIEELLLVMDKHGMLIPMNKSGADAV